MDLTRKTNPQKRVILAFSDLPERLLPPVPTAVADRFPEMVSWAATVEQNYSNLREVLRREFSRIAESINT